MSLINSGLRQGNHEDEEKETEYQGANDLTIIRQEDKNERRPQQEQNFNEFSLFSNDLFSNSYGKSAQNNGGGIENEDENNFWLNIHKQATTDDERAAAITTDSSAVCKSFAYSKF